MECFIFRMEITSRWSMDKLDFMHTKTTISERRYSKFFYSYYFLTSLISTWHKAWLFLCKLLNLAIKFQFKLSAISDKYIAIMSVSWLSKNQWNAVSLVIYLSDAVFWHIFPGGSSRETSRARLISPLFYSVLCIICLIWKAIFDRRIFTKAS